MVEHSLGKGEVESSILSCSTILFCFFNEIPRRLIPFQPRWTEHNLKVRSLRPSPLADLAKAPQSVLPDELLVPAGSIASPQQRDQGRRSRLSVPFVDRAHGPGGVCLRRGQSLPSMRSWAKARRSARRWRLQPGSPDRAPNYRIWPTGKGPPAVHALRRGFADLIAEEADAALVALYSPPETIGGPNWRLAELHECAQAPQIIRRRRPRSYASPSASGSGRSGGGSGSRRRKSGHHRTDHSRNIRSRSDRASH